jgi:hypothetical protein
MQSQSRLILEMIRIGKVKFTKTQMDEAAAEINRSGEFISSVQSIGFHIGQTQNADGMGYLSAYVNNVWLGIIHLEKDGSGQLSSISLPSWFLIALNTQHEKEAVALAAEISVHNFSEDEIFMHFLQDRISKLKENLENDGLIEGYSNDIYQTSLDVENQKDLVA